MPVSPRKISTSGLLRTLVVLAGIAGVCWLTWQTQRTALAEWLVSRQLGDAVQIDGFDVLGLGRSLHLSAGHVRASGDDTAVSIQRLEVKLLVAELLAGRFVFPLLAAEGIRISLQDAPGESEIRLPVLPDVHELAVLDLQLTYQSDDQDIRLTIDSLTGQGDTPSANVSLAVTGNLNDSPLVARATLPFALSTDTPTPVRIHVTWGTLEGRINGLVGDPYSGRGTDVRLQLKAPDSKALLALLGVQEMRAGAVDLEARVLDLGSTLNLQSRGSIGEFKLELSGTTRDLALNEVEGYFETSGPSLQEAGALLDYLGFDALPYKAKGNLTRKGSQLLVRNARLELAEGQLTLEAELPEFPDLARMTMKLSGRDFNPTLLQPLAGRCDLPALPFDWEGRLDRVDDTLRDVTLSMKSVRHELSIDGQFSWNASASNPALTVQAAGFTLPELGSCLGLTQLPQQPTTLAAKIQAAGGIVELQEVEVTADDLKVTGQVRIDTTGETPDLNGEVRFATDNLFQAIDAFTDLPLTLASEPASLELGIRGPVSNLELVDTRLRIAGAEGEVNGQLGPAGSLDALALDFSFRGDALQRVIIDAEQLSLSPKPFEISGRLVHAGESWRLEGMALSVAKTRINASASIPDGTGFRGARLRLDASGANIENLLGPFLDHPLPMLRYELTSELVIAEEGVDVELDAQIGEHRLITGLHIDRPPDFSQSHGNFRLEGPALEELVHLVDPDYQVLPGAYDMSFSLAGNNDHLSVNDLELRAGESDLTGQLQLSMNDIGRWRWQADLHSRIFFLPLIQPSLLETDTPVPDRTRYFSPDPLPLDWLEQADVSVDYAIDRMTINPETGTRIDIAFDLVNSRLQTRSISWDGNTSAGHAEADITLREGQANVQLDMYSNRLPLLWLLAGEPAPSDNTHYASQLTTSGDSVAALMENLNGQVLFLGGPGRVQTRQLDRLFGDFLHTISNSILGSRNRSETNVACSAGAATIEQGQVSLEPGLVIRTDRVDMFAGGSIDLAREKPNLGVFTRSRTGIGISAAKVIAPRLKVGGTLVKPRISVDTTGTALSTGFAFFSGGLSVLASGLLDRVVSGSRNPCNSLYDEARAQPRFKALAEMR